MRVRRDLRRAGIRLTSLAVVLLVAALCAPFGASALSVTQASTRPNGSSGQSVYGSIPTRFSWQMLVKKGDPAVSAVRIIMPKGTDLKRSTMTVQLVEGLTRIPLTTTPVIKGETIEVPLSPAVETTTNSKSIRLTVQEVSFPKAGGTYTIETVAVTPSGEVTVPSQTEPLVVVPMTTTELIIAWMNRSP